MTPTLFSLISLTLAFILLVVWAFSPRTAQRWKQASELPFAPDPNQDLGQGEQKESADD